MIVDICFIIMFMLVFIIFAIKGYNNRNYWHQFIALNSFITGTNILKDILPTTFNSIINIFRIFIAVVFIIICINKDLKYKKLSNE